MKNKSDDNNYKSIKHTIKIKHENEQKHKK